MGITIHNFIDTSERVAPPLSAPQEEKKMGPGTPKLRKHDRFGTIWVSDADSVRSACRVHAFFLGHALLLILPLRLWLWPCQQPQ